MARTRLTAGNGTGGKANTKGRGKKYVVDKPNKVRRRISPEVRALRDIKRYQNTHALLLPKLPFSRVVKEIMGNLTIGKDFRIQRLALEALQEATEAVIVDEFAMANLCAIHAKRVTIQVKDLQLVSRLRKMMMGRPF